MIFSTLRRYIKIPAMAFALLPPIEANVGIDIINKDIKTVRQSMANFKDPETGMDRLKKMFQLE